MSAPLVRGLLETSLYVSDLAVAGAFWGGVMGFSPLASDARVRAFDVGRGGVLLLFRVGATEETLHLPDRTVPSHGGRGHLHLAFEVATDDLPVWEQHLAGNKVAVESRTSWPGSATSIYFRDPDGHLVELATPGLWTTR